MDRLLVVETFRTNRITCFNIPGCRRRLQGKTSLAPETGSQRFVNNIDSKGCS